MKQVDKLLSDYAFYHRTKGNKLCHFIGIPLIIYGILAVLALLPLGAIRLTTAELLIVVVGIYYLILDVRLGSVMIVISVLVDAVACAVGDVRVGLSVLVIGWVFQTIGHGAFEKNRPAFLRNLLHLLVGPIFLLNEILHVRPVFLEPSGTLDLSR